LRLSGAREREWLGAQSVGGGQRCGACAARLGGGVGGSVAGAVEGAAQGLQDAARDAALAALARGKARQQLQRIGGGARRRLPLGGRQAAAQRAGNDLFRIFVE